MTSARISCPPAKLGFGKFLAFCTEEGRRMTRHAAEYQDNSARRNFRTFEICAELTEPDSRILSAGAGGAYVEKLLAQIFRARVTVVEFPEAIRAHQAEYDRFGFRTIGGDLTTDWQTGTTEPYDLALSFEVLEHLPISPYQHIGALSKHLRPGGHLVMSTPNFSRLPNVLRLMCGRPLMPDARLTLQATSYDQEHVHRREYVASELVDAVTQAGLTHVKTEYFLGFGSQEGTVKASLLRPICLLIPWMKNVLFIVARKDA